MLDEIMARVGVDGLTAAYAHPALMTVIDEHAAAVRAAVADADGRLNPVDLAAYAHTVIAGAAHGSRALPEPGAADMSISDWLGAPWELLRLVAVCALADEVVPAELAAV